MTDTAPELPPPKVEEEEMEENVEEEPDAEEALFVQMEQEEEAHDQEDQPVEITAAPRLLQKALQDGDVKASDSEEEEKKAVDSHVASPEHHVHQRVSVSALVASSRCS